jgi:hypothetical protein
MVARTLAFVLALAFSIEASAVQMVELRIKVTDSEGHPVESAKLKGAFFEDQAADKISSARHSGLTGNDGTAILAGHEDLYVDLWATKEGYYETKKRVIVRNNPSQGVSLLLRKIRNPIGMYAKRVVLEIPERGREYEFDFFKGDLVGQGYSGRRADITVRFDRDLVDIDTFTQTMTMRFVEPADGVARAVPEVEWKYSEYKSGYLAPLGGYNDTLVIVNAAKQRKVSKQNVNIPFYLRIRSRTDSTGKLESAYYCKVWPGVKLLGVVAEKPLLEMVYYCNPTENDRNVEFDIHKNLFGKLSADERVQVP